MKWNGTENRTINEIMDIRNAYKFKGLFQTNNHKK